LATGFSFKRGEEFIAILLIGGVGTGESRGADSGSASESLNFESGIVCEHGDLGSQRSGLCFDEGVGFERVACLFGGRLIWAG
jgi:hypothetical protein